MIRMNLAGYLINTIISLSIALLIIGSNAFADGAQTIQETHGDQSPNVITKGDVTLIYQGLPKEKRELLFEQLGNAQQLIQYLQKELDEKDKELAAKEALIQGWALDYEKLKNKYYKAFEANKLSKANLDAAKSAMIDGDLQKAKDNLPTTTAGGTASHH